MNEELRRIKIGEIALEHLFEMSWIQIDSF